MRQTAIAALCWLSCAIGACSGDGDRELSIGVEPHGGAGGARAGASGNGAAGDDAATAGRTAVGNGNALAVHVEDVKEITIEILTLACSGDCADIEAVAHGGNPPYAFEWEDGSTRAARHVCLSANAQLGVEVTDTEIVDDEFGYDAHAATADISAVVLDCSDAGVTPPPGETLCIDNPSFEGTPGVDGSSGAPPGTPGVPEDVGFHASPWVICDPSGTPDIWNEEQSWTGELGAPAASDGSTYLALYDVLGIRETAGQPLCAALSAGKSYSFLIDLSFRTQGAFLGAAAGALEIWASSDACGGDQLLFTSPIADADWQTHCVTFTAERAFEHIRFVPAAADGVSGVFVDNIVPVASCD